MVSPRVYAIFGLLLSLAGITASRAVGEAPPPAPGSGSRVGWEGWTFNWAVRPREGLVLTDVAFRGRSVMKYAGLEEIFVPYHPGQPRPEDSRDGMGINLQELIPGKDCIPGTVCRMFDAEGRPGGKPVVAMHEESAGLVYMGEKGRAYGKMLVLWCASKLGNYTYLIRWRFRDDGAMMPDIGLTGALGHTREAGPASQGAVVQKTPVPVWTPSHVHNFYYRLDFDIDGPENDVVEEANHAQETPGRSLASRDSWRMITREGTAVLNEGSFRSWRVADKTSRNAIGHRRSYELMPGGYGVFRGAADEEFAQADLWVVKQNPKEFPYSSVDSRPLKFALPSYLNNEPVDGEDVVVYYAMHVHHIPRSEEWPAMPIVWAGFTLMPRDFLDASPLKTQ